MKTKTFSFNVIVSLAGRLYVVNTETYTKNSIANKHLKKMASMFDGASIGKYTVTVTKMLFITHYSLRKHGL